MHRKNRMKTWAAAGLLCAGLASAAQTAHAQPANPPAAAVAAKSNALIVPINGTQQLRMATRQPIRSVINEKDNIARVQALANDTTGVLVVGLQAGSTRLTLTDTNGVVETVDVLVQLDIDAVKSVIRLTFPTANVTPIAAGSNVIVLTGNVAHPEDIEPILRVARGVLGTVGQGTTDVFNAMTVGGVKQVQLDCTIAQVNRSEARRRNASWIIDNNSVSVSSVLPGLQTPVGALLLSSSRTPGFTPSQLQLSPLNPDGNVGPNLILGVAQGQFQLAIQALRVENLAKLLAEPKLITMSGMPATFQSGGRQATLSPASGINGPGVTYEPIGTELNFLPIVKSNGRIFMQVQPRFRAVNQGLGITTSFGFVPGFDEQVIQTSVELDPGHTFAIGGLIQTQTSADSFKVPVLGDLPFIGPAFSSVRHAETESELIILVTPYLIDSMDCKQAPCKLPGTETRKPDDFELFLETIMEAPRGQRQVFPDGRFTAAYLSDPTASQYPCGGDKAPPPRDRGGYGCNTCGTGGCSTCGTGQPAVFGPTTLTNGSAPRLAPVTQPVAAQP